jgi:hypothetical protein
MPSRINGWSSTHSTLIGSKLFMVRFLSPAHLSGLTFFGSNGMRAVQI